MRVIVDLDVCMANGECVLAAPGVFRLDDEGYLQFDPEVTAAQRARVEEAALVCPTQAISIADD
jgi:ferredoxin